MEILKRTQCQQSKTQYTSLKLNMYKNYKLSLLKAYDRFSERKENSLCYMSNKKRFPFVQWHPVRIGPALRFKW